MDQPLHKLLILGDRATNAGLIERALRKLKARFEVRWAAGRETLESELSQAAPDVIVLDFALPRFNGVAALMMVRGLAPTIPCVILTSPVDEETAVECIKAGATDYVLKNNLIRLGAALEGALAGRRIKDYLAKINACFLRFGVDPLENINRLITLCRELTGSDFVVYYRSDGGILYSAGTVVSAEFGTADERSLTRAVMTHRGNELFAAMGMMRSRFAASDPFIREQRIESCLAKPVNAGGQAVGALCALFRGEPGTPSSYEELMGIISGAIGIEEQRLIMEKLRGRLMEELRQSQKMEAIGRLAGGVAHDFNNALTAIQGHCEMLMKDIPMGSAAFKDLAEIRRSSQYAASLTRQLLAFSRKQLLSPKMIDLNETVASISRMLRRLLGENIELRTRLGRPLGLVRADPGQLDQVLVNLAINARDAMPEGGELIITTSNTARGELSLSAPSVMIMVEDTGCGMSGDVLSHIFEPFFTTKEKGQGTGLGLSTVYGIVKQSGGEINVSSQLGRGTQFRIYFPRIDDADLAHQTEESRSPVPSLAHETILLVEDDDALRKLFRRVLASQGYQVIEASDGTGALAAARLHEGAIDLLVTDVIMPGLNGRQLADRLSATRPEMKALFVSGYTDHAVVHNGIVDPGIELLQKPFLPSELAERIRKMLDDHSASSS
ncbi:MAG: response regulator [Elusimicrobia bacterium]|nr:response regulator [Elusimicrobiota bacterium]